MKRMDFSCFTGSWPFRKTRYNTVEKLALLHSRCGIEGGYVSAFEAIFYQDPYEAEENLAAQLQGTPYRQAMVLNPMLPAWREDLSRAVERLHIHAVRLVPGYHGYQLTDPIMDSVCAALQTYHLPLILNPFLEDARTAWMFRPRMPEPEELRDFLEAHSEIPTLVSNIRVTLLKQLAPLFRQRQNLFCDTAGFMAGLFPVEEAWDAASGQLVFGTCAPLIEMQSIRCVVDMSAADNRVKAAVYSGKALLNYFENE